MTAETIEIDKFPATRYQGSKRRLLPWFHETLKSYKFKSALDLFGGTGIVSYLFKKMGKRVFYNDILKFNYWIGVALIENSEIKLSDRDIEFLLNKQKGIDYPRLIQVNFRDIYYKDDENRFLDMIVKNIQMFDKRYDNEIAFYKKSMAYYSLFQSCIIKRPFNLFHRKNLNIRLSNVHRTFGNKTTWERSFEHYFIKFVLEINKSVFDNGEKNIASNFDALNYRENDFDLVYIDPPYTSEKIPTRICNYYKNYHFLEGIVNYDKWLNSINFNFNNLPLNNDGYNWTSKDGNIKGFEKIIENFQDSIIVLSYKDPGSPSIKELIEIIQQYKKSKVNIYKTPHFYALNKNNGHYSEILIVAK